MHILLVEDDESLYNLYSTEFDLNGHTVVWHKVGTGVVDRIKKEKPDAILLDIMLPEKTGLEILKDIKANKDVNNIPVIMLTNFGNEENVSMALELGALDYLMKYKITPSEMKDRLSTLLGQSTGSGVKLTS